MLTVSPSFERCSSFSWILFSTDFSFSNSFWHLFSRILRKDISFFTPSFSTTTFFCNVNMKTTKLLKCYSSRFCARKSWSNYKPNETTYRINIPVTIQVKIAMWDDNEIRGNSRNWFSVGHHNTFFLLTGIRHLHILA